MAGFPANRGGFLFRRLCLNDPRFSPRHQEDGKGRQSLGVPPEQGSIGPPFHTAPVSCGLGTDFTTCHKEGGTRGQRPQLWKHCTRAHILGLRQGKSQVLSVSQVLRLQNEVHALHLGTVEFPGSETALGSPVVGS